MRLLLISDTHGRLGIIDALASHVRADAVIHAGDFGFYDDGSYGRLSARELRLQVEQAFSVLARIPGDTVDIGRGIKAPRWYRGMTHVNLPDAHVGYAVMDIDEAGRKLQTFITNPRVSGVGCTQRR